MHCLNQADRTYMRRNEDDNFTYEVGLDLRIFKLKMSLHIAYCIPTNIDISSRFFLIIISEKKSSNVFTCVEILQYLSYVQYEQHRDSKLSKEDMK